MKKKLRDTYLLTHNLLYDSASIIGNALGLNQRSVSILCYHGISNKRDEYSVSLKTFKLQIDRIRKFSNIVSLDEIVKVVNDEPIDLPAVAITFDDGFANVLEYALPMLERFKIKPAIFILSNPKNANRKQLGNHERFLTEKQILILKNKGWTIGCHSATHADFRTLSAKEIEKEIINSKKKLEAKLGFTIDYFAYPKSVVNSKIIEAVKKAGYKAAFTIKAGNISTSSNRWLLPRTMIDRSVSPKELPHLYLKSSLAIRNITDQLKIRQRLQIT